jgi:C-terminal processing protease CtpA/Prc
MYRLFIPIMVVFALVSSCKKDKGGGGGTPPPVVKDKVKDTTIQYTRDIYLWYQQIPSSFNEQSYADPNKIMEAIRKYSTEPGFPQAVDRWSFAMKQAEWDDVSGGIAGDFGFSVFFRAEGDLRVKYVERASPAGVKGMHRGWRVTKINGSTNITTANSDFIVDAIFYSTSGNFTFQKPDGSSVDVALTATTYQEHPIFLDSVYTAGTKKVGYMVFNSFLGDTTEVYSEFQRIFNKFNAQGVNDVAVDLRYNGGGYVSVQQKLANYLVSNAASGGVMMNQVFNDKYASWNESDNFNKLGPLNLPRVFFIVSNNTASASELLINNLRPYMDVKLVGPGATYGKPVGYFPIPVGDWYIFPVSFRSTNKNGQGNYFSGFSVDSQQPDGLDKDWGDINETAFASVLKYVGTGSFTRTTEIPGAANISVTPQIINSNQKLDVKSFKGAVLSSRKLN